jgi:hypothetical protein
MKAFILFAIAALFFWLGTTHCHASERCVKDSNGGICCWDTDSEGTIKPISCA